MAEDRFISLSIDAAQLLEAEARLAHIKRGAPRALARALNKTITGMRTDTVREIRAQYQVKAGDVRETLRIQRANANNLTAHLFSHGTVIPLIKFRVTPAKTGGKRPRRGLRITIKQGEPKRWPHAFVAQVGSNLNVFTRTGTKRFPIKKQFGPSIPSMLYQDGVRERLQQLANTRLAQAVTHEVEWMEQGG